MKHISHIVLSGSYGTGKSTVLGHLRAVYGSSLYYIPDGGEAVIATFEKPIDTFTREENIACQKGVFEYYQRHVAEGLRQIEAGNAHLMVSDASVLENYVYAAGMAEELGADHMNAILEAVKQIAGFSLFMYFPAGQFSVENNAIRHTDDTYQLEVAEHIKALHSDYQCAVKEVKSKTVANRLEEVVSSIDSVFQSQGKKEQVLTI